MTLHEFDSLFIVLEIASEVLMYKSSTDIRIVVSYYRILRAN